MSDDEKRSCRQAALEEAAARLAAWYPDNANTGAFCAAIRSMKNAKPEDE
jgi:hypothetical protein